MDTFIESGYVSLNKSGEELCGDRIEVINCEDSTTLVLADGLGSGVKANILATMTSKIIGTMMTNGLAIEDAVETIASTLPVCKERQLAYSTFSILQISRSKEAYLVEFDNPSMIFLRHGKCVEYERSKKMIFGKTIYESRFAVEKGDMFLLLSDGVIHAGVGQLLNFGWQLGDVKKFVEGNYTGEVSAKSMSAFVADACNNLYGNKPGDDTSVAVLRIRENKIVDLLVGPPVHREDDQKVVQAFLDHEGFKVICGGTTSQIVSRYLHEEVTTDLAYQDPNVPPIGYMKGIDLVTEGVLTLGKVRELSKKYLSTSMTDVASLKKKDGASLLLNMLFEKSTEVHFYVGRAINPAHQNPDMPIDLSIKLRLVLELAKSLEQMGKKVVMNYY